MRKKFLFPTVGLAVGLALGFLLPAHWLFVDAHEKHVADGKAGVKYACPMFCVVVKKMPPDKKCSVCGMKLAEITDKSTLNVAERRMVGLEVGPLERRKLTRTVRLVGEVDYDETRLSRITTRAAGWLEKVWVDSTWKEVEKGQELAAIYSPELYSAQKEYLLAEGALREAAARRLRLFGISETEIAELRKTGKVKESLTLRAPRKGVVIERRALEGAAVKKGDTLYRIADLSHLWVQADVYERDLPSVSVGQAVRIEVDGRAAPIMGTVAFLDPALDRHTRTARMRIEVKNDGLRIGQRVDAWIETTVDGTPLAIPRTAVLSTGARAVAYVLFTEEPGMQGDRDYDLNANNLPDTVLYDLVTIRVGPLAIHEGREYYPMLSGKLEESMVIVTRGNLLLDSQAQLLGRPSLLFPKGSRGSSDRAPIRTPDIDEDSMTALVRFCIRNPFIALVVAAAAVAWGWSAWEDKTVDAIPDISENQTVVVTDWPGRSPQDVEDQITYPLATSLAGVKGVKEIRGLSGFGFSQVYIVFEEEIRFSTAGMVDDFYEARTRVLEKLASIGKDLPDGVTPELGPDATALGQVFWYTVEGPYDLATLRSVQDWIVRYELQTVSGVAEVASAGGMVREYQVDVDPNRLRHYGVGLMDVTRAIREGNLDVGAKTIEASGMEYVVRGLGFLKSKRDIEQTVVKVRKSPMPGADPTMSMPHAPVTVRDVADVRIGPAFRRGALADDRMEQVGGVVVMRFGANPRDVIERVRKAVVRMNDPASGVLPEGVRIVPFYDRTQLINETVETLETALLDELWITLAVVLIFLLHVRSSLIIASTLPIAVLLSFVAMSLLGVDSNIMSLTGIAIAIGTMVDMGIVMTENVYRRLVENQGLRPRREIIESAAMEVAPALATAIATTIVSFLPIFFLTDMEGKLFRPLAWTKTFALAAAAITGVLIVPVLCRLFLRERKQRRMIPFWAPAAMALPFGWIAARANWLGLRGLLAGLLAVLLAWFFLHRLTCERMRPIDENPVSRGVAGSYERMLRWILAHKAAFFVLPGLILALGIFVTVGFSDKSRLRPVRALAKVMPGLGQEFMPPLDEGSLLYMPSLLPQAGLTETLDVMKRQNAAMRSVPEVAKVVGKLGRAESALDPAPVGMLETLVQLKPKSEWRKGFTKADIQRELMAAVHTPGASEGAGAWLQPIETRVIMLNSGIRAPLALKLIGSPPGLDTREAVQLLESVAGKIRDRIADVDGVAGPNVENIGSKPYIEFEIHRDKVGHYGLTLADVQHAIMTAIGGATITRTLEGRERYAVRVAYARELRDRREALRSVLVEGAGKLKVQLTDVATIHEVVGPAVIKTEDGRLRLHVTFAAAGRDEGSVMEAVVAEVEKWRAEHIAQGHPDPVPIGVAVEPAGRYESQVRARKRFGVLIPICFGIILFLLYLNFRNWPTVFNVFAAVPVVIAGGLILIWAYPHLWDAAHAIGLTERPSTGPIYITVAVIVGFIALLGIATDDGVIMATRLEQQFKEKKVRGIGDIRDRVVEAGLLRIRPCLMTTFTTIIALMPILLSTGTGSDVAQPMAIPAVGGMLAELISLFIVPCVYCIVKEFKWRRGWKDSHFER